VLLVSSQGCHGTHMFCMYVRTCRTCRVLLEQQPLVLLMQGLTDGMEAGMCTWDGFFHRMLAALLADVSPVDAYKGAHVNHVGTWLGQGGCSCVCHVGVHSESAPWTRKAYASSDSGMHLGNSSVRVTLV
jgi:hypothetical protein